MSFHVDIETNIKSMHKIHLDVSCRDRQYSYSKVILEEYEILVRDYDQSKWIDTFFGHLLPACLIINHERDQQIKASKFISEGISELFGISWKNIRIRCLSRSSREKMDLDNITHITFPVVSCMCKKYNGILLIYIDPDTIKNNRWIEELLKELFSNCQYGIFGQFHCILVPCFNAECNVPDDILRLSAKVEGGKLILGDVCKDLILANFHSVLDITNRLFDNTPLESINEESTLNFLNSINELIPDIYEIQATNEPQQLGESIQDVLRTMEKLAKKLNCQFEKDQRLIDLMVDRLKFQHYKELIYTKTPFVSGTR